MAAKEGGSPFDETLDDVAVLGEQHRDAVVEILAEGGSPVRLSGLAELVVAEARGVSPDGVATRDVEPVELSLHHDHLSKLDAAGVVEYAPEEKRVAPADGIEAATDLVGSAYTFSTV